ncbi:MAG: hypothetical protein U0I22_07840 [Treponema sp.]|nr:hypothetical protein [Treponema sp.]
MSLYAYFEESDIPDSKPMSQQVPCQALALVIVHDSMIILYKVFLLYQILQMSTKTENPIQTDEKVLELRDWFNDWREFRGGHIEWALEKYFQERLDSRRMEDIVSYHCGDGYISTSQASIQNIYRLDFLTMKQYECKRLITTT